MDFREVGLGGLVGSETSRSSSSGFAAPHAIAASSCSDPEIKRRSGFLMQERSGAVTTEDDWRSSKLSRTDYHQSMLQFQHRNALMKSSTVPSTNTTLFTDGQQQQTLSFSCPKLASLPLERCYQNSTLPCFQLTSSAYNRNTGYSSGIFNGAGNMHGPFTESQWMELEHQALIYKYITANVPIPSNLLIPIRKALDSARLSTFSGGLFRPSTLQWGTFHLGFSGSSDPEPGRCRRTDGKKWRCSRDAVADQKYCERHMNRGRHRSRKPVEGQPGHSAASTTAKPMPSACSTPASVVGHCGDTASNSLTMAQQQQQLKNLQSTSSTNLSAANPLGRMFLNKESERTQDSTGLCMLSTNSDLKSKESPFLISKQRYLCEESSRTEFGLVPSDSLLNPSQKNTSLMSCRNFGSSQDPTDQESVSQHSLRQFMDDWPKNQSDRSAVSWSKLDMQSDRTQLSISIPIAPSDFMPSTSPPNDEKVNLSPLRLSREFDPIQMGLGVGRVLNEPNQRQADWIPISWETPMGGPLGEVLHNTNNSAVECKNSSALNLMAEGWDGSPRVGSSPTGVLQKATFGSFSNSSAGSSPRGENIKINEGASLCNDRLGSSLVHSLSMPAL